MKYFTIAELSRSQTAVRCGVRNEPPAAVRRNLSEFVDKLLDPLREAWSEHCLRLELGTPAIQVTSAYRSPMLNTMVGGSPTSAHCDGLAADIVPRNGHMAELRACVNRFLAERDFDQLIFEQVDARGVPQWIHLALRSRDGLQRREVLEMCNGKYTRQ